MSHDAHVERVHTGPVFGVEVLTYRDSAGREVRRDVVRHPGAVLIVPVLADGRLVMIRNYRIAPNETLWEFAAGKREHGEDPELTARRELEEETGYRADRIESLGEFYTSPGFSDELMHVYAASELSEVGHRREPGEEIEVKPVTLANALRLLDDGSLRDGKSIAGLMLWMRREDAAGHPSEAQNVDASSGGRP